VPPHAFGLDPTWHRASDRCADCGQSPLAHWPDFTQPRARCNCNRSGDMGTNHAAYETRRTNRTARM